jgi:predicted DNA-binding protein
MAKDSLKTAVISIRVRPEIKAGLENLAEADRRPLSSYLENLIEDHLNNAMGDTYRRSLRNRK